jgi:hypothetical protein
MGERRGGSAVGKGGRIIATPLSHKSGEKGLMKDIDD